VPNEDLYTLLLSLKYTIDKAFRDIMTKLSIKDVNISYMKYDPPYDLIDLGDEFLLKIDLPGFTKDDIRIRASDELVEVRAKSKGHNEIKGKYIVRERIEGDVEKKVQLPAKIRPHEVRAILKHGVLEIYMPKAEVVKEVDITIE